MKYQEDDLQMSVCRFLDLSGVLWTHVANERKTSPIAGRRLKMKGVKSGVPDCLIFEPRGRFVGLAIELKVERDNGSKQNGQPRKKTKGRLTENQKYWLTELSLRGWSTCVCYNFDEVIEQFENYFKQ